MAHFLQYARLVKEAPTDVDLLEPEEHSVQVEFDWRVSPLEAVRRWLLAPLQWLREWREAQARAEALLRACLSDKEYDFLRAQGYLQVTSPSIDGRTYRIPADASRVKVYEGGRLAGELCVAPVGPVPSGDVVLAHKLMIEANEEEYLRVARWIQPLPPEFPQFGLYYDFWRARRADQAGQRRR